MPRQRCPAGTVRVGNKCVTRDEAGKRKVCKMLKESVADENKAGWVEYPRLSRELNKIGHPQDASTVMSVAQDEKNHYRLMKNMKQDYCGA